MKTRLRIKLFWAAMVIGMAWSAYSSTAGLLTEFDRLRDTLLVCGNSLLIKSVI